MKRRTAEPQNRRKHKILLAFSQEVIYNNCANLAECAKNLIVG